MRIFLLQTLGYMFQALKLIFQGLQHKFQSLKHKPSLALLPFIFNHKNTKGANEEADA
jgi:hypothetical protein